MIWVAMKGVKHRFLQMVLKSLGTYGIKCLKCLDLLPDHFINVLSFIIYICIIFIYKIYLLLFRLLFSPFKLLTFNYPAADFIAPIYLSELKNLSNLRVRV